MRSSGARSGPERGYAATPGVKQVAWQVTPGPASSASIAFVVVRVLDDAERSRAPRPRSARRSRPDRPRPRPRPRRRRRRRGRSRRRAGRRYAPAAARPPRRRGGRAVRARAPRRAAPGSPARSRGRRPRRSGSSRGRPRRPRGSAPASPRCRRSPRSRGRSSTTTGYSIPSRATAATTCSVVARGREAAGVHADHAQAVLGVAPVPRAQVGERAQRVGAAEVPELDEHGPAALLVHAQRRDVDPGQLPREGRSGDGVLGRAHRGDASRGSRPVPAHYDVAQRHRLTDAYVAGSVQLFASSVFVPNRSA